MTETRYMPTGSRISGNGYSTSILRACPYALPNTEADWHHTCPDCLYAVELRYEGQRGIIPTPGDGLTSSYTRAVELARAWCHVHAQYQRVQRVNAWLAASPSNAVIGAW